jgi:drug/metabolite transporter (DMT)-like permease
MDRTHAEIITALSLAAVAVFVAFAFRVARVGDRHRAEYAAARVTAVLGTAFLLTAIAYAASPSIVSRSPLGHALDPFAWVPYAFYGLGGILAVIAVTRHAREIEAAAVVALGTGWLLNAVALVAVHPTDMRWGVYALYVLYAGRRLHELDLGRR